MKFSESVAHCFSNYATFKGRAPRSEFWWFMLFGVLANIILVIIDGIFFGLDDNSPQIFSSIFALVILLPSIAVGARRLHDINKSG